MWDVLGLGWEKQESRAWQGKVSVPLLPGLRKGHQKPSQKRFQLPTSIERNEGMPGKPPLMWQEREKGIPTAPPWDTAQDSSS